jgi:ketosteroid isomerase-like protein
MQKLASLAAGLLVLLVLAPVTPRLSAQAATAADDKAAIKTLYSAFNHAFNKKDVNAIMAVYAPDVFAFDAIPPREYPTWAAYKKDWEGLFSTFPGPVTNSISELHITVVDSVAYTRCIDDAMFTGKDGTKTHLVVRVTDVLRKSNGKWLIVQEHVSFPADPITGKADLLSTP